MDENVTRSWAETVRDAVDADLRDRTEAVGTPAARARVTQQLLRKVAVRGDGVFVEAFAVSAGCRGVDVLALIRTSTRQILHPEQSALLEDLVRAMAQSVDVCLAGYEQALDAVTATCGREAYEFARGRLMGLLTEQIRESLARGESAVLLPADIGGLVSTIRNEWSARGEMAEAAIKAVAPEDAWDRVLATMAAVRSKVRRFLFGKGLHVQTVDDLEGTVWLRLHEQLMHDPDLVPTGAYVQQIAATAVSEHFADRGGITHTPAHLARGLVVGPLTSAAAGVDDEEQPMPEPSGATWVAEDATARVDSEDAALSITLRAIAVVGETDSPLGPIASDCLKAVLISSDGRLLPDLGNIGSPASLTRALRLAAETHGCSRRGRREAVELCVEALAQAAREWVA